MSSLDSCPDPTTYDNNPDFTPVDVSKHLGAAKRPLNVAFLGTLPPNRCGIATFTADLMQAVAGSSPEVHCLPVCVADTVTAERGLSVVKGDRQSYVAMADRLNGLGIDLLCVQHEYGIFGGPDGEMLLALLDRLEAPVVATLHTVLDRPGANQRRVMDALVARAARLVVMTERSADIMRAEHAVSGAQGVVVPHGVPPPPAEARRTGRRMLGIGEQKLLLTFGLLSPGKGIEHAIRALPAIVARTPDLLYVVLGVTHPNLVREQGEAYREGLVQLARDLGVARNVRFENRFVDATELANVLGAADIYVTPYLNEAQSVSGTLAYSYGLGTPVVSTPYHHAAELLAEGRGLLVPFADSGAIACAVNGLLADPARLAAIRSAAREAGREMTWPRIGHRYSDVFQAAAAEASVLAA